MIRKLTRGIVTALIAITVLLPFNKVKAGIPVGTWRAHPAYNNATHSLKAFGQIFVLSEGAIYSYDPADDAIYTIDKTGGLSDTDISAMDYYQAGNALVLAYSNGNIDILYGDGTIYNFTDLKNNSLGGATVNQLRIIDDIAYLSTNIGLVFFDLKKLEIKTSYRFDSPVISFVFTNDSLYCSTEDGLYLGITTENLLDNSKWKKVYDLKMVDMFMFDNKIIALTKNNKVWTIDRNTNNFRLRGIINNVTALSKTRDNRMMVIQDTVVSFYDNLKESESYSLPKHINWAISDKKNLWTCQGYEGLNLYDVTDSVLVCKKSFIKPNSPRYNWFHSVSWPQNGKLLAICGCYNISGIDYPGSVMIYENERWSHLEENIPEKTGLKYINLTEAVQDPKKPNHIFVGSAGQGLYEFEDNLFQKLHTWNNSGLTSILNDNERNKYNYVRISALQYDKYGNLWMANNLVDTILKVLEPNGNWFGLYYKEMAGLPSFKQLKFRNDLIWIYSSRYVPGIICIDNNKTLKDNSDDSIRFSGPYFTNQDGVTEEICDIYFYEFDLNGVMWIGTDKGIFILKNPDDYIFNNEPVFERIKIARNDGSGLADYLFSGVNTTALYIDQGNRKWIGTLDDGIFLMSADGTKTLEHFTVNNSPLPSNNILSITENGQDGSLFFGTSLGMIEYGGQARDPEESLSESNILVYPNPVKPDFDGYVTITGLTEWSTVRIIGNSGSLIHVGTSNGGSYSWNLTDINGKLVPSGVYHAIITNQENNKSESVSITIIR